MIALGLDPGKSKTAVAIVEAAPLDGALRPVCRRVEIVHRDETAGTQDYLRRVADAVACRIVDRACVERMEISMKRSASRGNERDRTTWADMEPLVLVTAAALLALEQGSPTARVEFSPPRIWKGGASKLADHAWLTRRLGWATRELSDHRRPTSFGRYEPPELIGFKGKAGAEWRDGMDAVSMAVRTLDRRAVRRF